MENLCQATSTYQSHKIFMLLDISAFFVSGVQFIDPRMRSLPTRDEFQLTTTTYLLSVQTSAQIKDFCHDRHINFISFFRGKTRLLWMVEASPEDLAAQKAKFVIWHT